MRREIWASALLVDDKIKYWKVSDDKRSCVEDFYKEFMYDNCNMKDYLNKPNCKVENQKYEVTNEIASNIIFDELAPAWFKQWELIDDYKGIEPYELEGDAKQDKFRLIILIIKQYIEEKGVKKCFLAEKWELATLCFLSG